MLVWQWALVILLSMVPALVAGPSAGIAAGMHFGFRPAIYLPVVALSSFVEGLGVVKLAERARDNAWLERKLGYLRTPRAHAWAERWGPWGGLILGVAVVGQEPILIALVWLGVERRRLLLPLAASSALFTALYFALIHFGVESATRLDELWQLLRSL